MWYERAISTAASVVLVVSCIALLVVLYRSVGSPTQNPASKVSFCIYCYLLHHRFIELHASAEDASQLTWSELEQPHLSSGCITRDR